jgi:hypothetical protein
MFLLRDVTPPPLKEQNPIVFGGFCFMEVERVVLGRRCLFLGVNK